MYPGHGSLRGRLIFVSAILLTTLFSAASYLQFSADTAFERSRDTAAELRRFLNVLAALKTALYEAEGGLYDAALMSDAALTRVKAAQERIRTQAERLRELAAPHPDRKIRDVMRRLGEGLEKLDADLRALAKPPDRSNARSSPSSSLVNRLLSTDERFLQVLDAAVASARGLDDKVVRERALKYLGDIRYYWERQKSATFYLAERSARPGPLTAKMRRQLDHRLAYLRGVDNGLKRLRTLRRQGRKHPVFEAEVAEMERTRRDSDRFFQQITGIEPHKARAPKGLHGDRVKLGFSAVWKLIGDMENRLDLLATASLRESMDTAGMLSGFLWVVTLLAAGFVISTYLAYANLVRAPLGQVTDALRALERGAGYSPVVRTAIKETDAVLQAFSDMQRQVHARETRLTAILDNAGEGIITINAEGVIETFNNAAEQIFVYDESEVIGTPFSLLIAESHEGEKADFPARYLETKEGDALGREVTVTARRKDGSLFPMALNVTALELEGHRHFTAIVEDISERKALMDHLRQLAEHDSLTSLYNRQYFLSELDRVVARSVRQGGLECALLYIDLDNFKFVNDTLGHQAGDRVLVDVAAMMAQRSRRGDVIARLGGDEFAVILFEVDDAQACAVADNYRQLLAEYSFRHDGRVIDVGCSIGAAMLSRDISTKEDLMARADISCHMAKCAGRNSVHLYRPDDRQSMDDMSMDMSWARTIKHAIEFDRFDFALQPIVNVRTGVVEKYEALLRMLDADGKPIMPSGFVPSAERFGLILDIDRWVVEHAIDLVRRRNCADEQLSINLSAKSIGDAGLLLHTTRVLTESGIDPTRLTFEITETVAIADLSAAIALLEQLRDLGCHTALDDFGAGYSSFAYLKDLPVDFVKIDGSFVRNIDEDALHLAMVKSMNEIAHAMGKKTVAEFVANGDILTKLREIGVDYAQGFHMGKPELAGYPDLAASPEPPVGHRRRKRLS